MDQEKPSTHFSKEQIEGTVSALENKSFEIFVQSLNGIPMRGLVYCEDPYIVLQKNAFGGVRTRVQFTVNAMGLDSEESLSGVLSFVYLGGEKQIPYHFVVEKADSAKELSSLHHVRDLQRLSEEDKKAAVRLFDYRDFLSAPLMQTAKAMKVYELFKTCGNRTLALEEFLAYFSHRPKNALHRKSYRFAEPRKEVSPLDFPSDCSTEEKISLCIRRGERSEEAFALYKKGVEENVKLTNLYENLLYSMPKGYKEELPRAVYLYFSYEYRVEEGIAPGLYYNILHNFEENTEIYRHFAKQMQDYAVESFLKGKMNEELAYIYKKLILADMVDEKMAEKLPALLGTYKFVVEDREIEKIVLSHPALKGEELYSLKEGVAYIPMPYKDMILLFQDGLGNRYAEVSHRKTKVFDGEELEEKLQHFQGSSPFFLLREALRIVREGIQTEEELACLEKVFSTASFSTSFRMEVLDRILDYHKRGDSSVFPAGKDLHFLYDLPIVAMNRKEKENYLSALLYRGEWEHAVQLYRNHPYLTIEKELLSPFAEALMEREEKDLALYLAHLAFRKASLSDRGLSYLLEEWDGGSKEMYAILKKGEERREEKGKVDSAQLLNMAERLLAQCLFTDKIREAQEAFTLYRKFSGRETLLLRAFLTAYAAAIFLYQKRESKEFTELLYEEVRGEAHKERVPVLYLLALSFSFSKRESLTADETEVLEGIMPLLLEKNLVFSYTKKLSRFLSLPEEILEKTVVEYHGRAEEKPYFSVRTPGEESFHREELQHSYHGIYTASFLLFPGESMEYRFTMGKEERVLYTAVLKKEEGESVEGENVYALLCKMGKLLLEEKGEELLPLMEEYQEKELSLSKVLHD